MRKISFLLMCALITTLAYAQKKPLDHSVYDSWKSISGASVPRNGDILIYNINPGENAVIGAMAANFQDGITPGKIQFGSGWWFNDQIDGMEQQMNTLSLQGLLSRFVGMLTDSRSFVSYPRHEYFRRILCNLVGKDVQEGLIPECEMPRVEAMIEDICYKNAKQYFNF